MQCDVAHWEKQVDIFNAAVSLWGRIDYVFSNAGVGERVWLPTVTPQSGEFVKPDLTVCNYFILANGSLSQTEIVLTWK
jgi:NAD(P)-dependent dehydrogenase (short-subunit alcohol dehydrogenase family)